MNARRILPALALVAAAALTACGGGGASSGSLTPPAGGSGNGFSVASQTEDSIGAANEVGAPMSQIGSYNQAMSSPAQSVSRMAPDALANGACSQGVEFFSPDKNGDANSTERIVFYDNACTQMQSDAVRVFTQNGSGSETVQRTVSRYALGSAAPASVRTSSVNYTNAAFDRYGYPIYADGFDRTYSGELNVNGVKTTDGAGELAVLPFSGGTASFCSDSAGFNATGNAALNETFGWAGTIAQGTRTVNADGSVTWDFTHGGSTYTGPIGGLSIQAGAQNTTCPIATPMFALAGGTLKGTYSLPIQATFAHGVLTDLTIDNASLANGDTLNVQTNAGLSPADEHFISGTLSASGAQVASFNVDAFGDGTLVVASSGQAYTIDDWHVVK